MKINANRDVMVNSFIVKKGVSEVPDWVAVELANAGIIRLPEPKVIEEVDKNKPKKSKFGRKK